MNPAASYEVLALSVEKLGDDNRLCEIFPMDMAGAEKFIESADYYYLAEEVRSLVDGWKFMLD